jgi:hypothetical protein
VFPEQIYNLPKGKMGNTFIFTLAKILEGVQARRWNSEHLLVFFFVMLQGGNVTIKSAKVIMNRITWRMEAWDREGDKLVHAIVTYVQAKLSFRQDEQSPERRTRIFQARMLKRDVRRAVKYLTESEKGGLLLPDGIDEKAGCFGSASFEAPRCYVTSPILSTPTQNWMGEIPQRMSFTEMGKAPSTKMKQDMMETLERSMITSIWKHPLHQWDFRNDESHKDKTRSVVEYKQHALDEKIKTKYQDKATLMHPLDQLQEQQFNIPTNELLLMSYITSEKHG